MYTVYWKKFYLNRWQWGIHMRYWIFLKVDEKYFAIFNRRTHGCNAYSRVTVVFLSLLIKCIWIHDIIYRHENNWINNNHPITSKPRRGHDYFKNCNMIFKTIHISAQNNEEDKYWLIWLFVGSKRVCRSVCKKWKKRKHIWFIYIEISINIYRN